MSTKQYAVVIERTPNNYGAYVPDLPGCVATGKTHDEVVNRIREAIVLHLDSMRRHDEPIPDPTTETVLVEVGA